MYAKSSNTKTVIAFVFLFLVQATVICTVAANAAEPYAGKLYRVSGVAFGDWLKVRRAPGTDQIILDILPSNATGIKLTGKTARTNDGGTWVEVKFEFSHRVTGNGRDFVSAEPIEGWINFRHLTPYEHPVVAPDKASTYVGRLLWAPQGDGRTMRLEEKFGYVDATGLPWLVPAGTIVDGASIPRALWPFVGSPFTGKYRDASVIHDYYCATRERPWRSTHRVFYDGMLARGTDPSLADLMYYTVYRFGPRWTAQKVPCYLSCADGGEVALEIRPEFVKSEFEDMKARIEKGGLTLEEIEATADRQLANPSVRVSGTYSGLGWSIDESLDETKTGLKTEMRPIRSMADVLPSGSPNDDFYKERGLPGLELILPSVDTEQPARP